MGVLDDRVRLQQAHHQRLLGVQDATGNLVGDAWDTFGGLNDEALAAFSSSAAVVVDAAKLNVATLAAAYMNGNDRIGGYPGQLVPSVPMIRGGVSTIDVYSRPIITARREIAKGHTFDQAMSTGRARAVSTARTDVVLTNRAAIDEGAAARPHVVGYRRVLTGKSCGFCATASTQRYHSADLLPLHPGCDCDIAEIIGTEDPGHIINHDLLHELKSKGVVQDITRAGDRQYRSEFVVDEHNVIRKRSVVDGQQVLGEKVKIEVVDHPELGPTLGPKTSPKPSTASSPEPAKLRTKSTATDPDVLAEASRRNVSPERVVELRNEKAKRRFLEDRARREAAKSLAATDADVVRIAKANGVHPDEVLAARRRVAEVRAVAREEAARVQLEAMRELDRFEGVKIKSPPRIGARTGTGSAARRGEWDWLEQLSDDEKARLSRSWYGEGLAPDQLAHVMAGQLGRDIGTDEAMQIWLDLNRRAEASGALRRGKLPSLRAYSGHIDPDRLLSSIADDGYDVARLFGDDLEAAGHIASIDADLARREALDYLGHAANPTKGPAPYHMGFQSWEDDVRTIEAAIRDGRATAAQVSRYAELVPEALDDAGLDYEDLYARIVTTARKAGEEVPAHARIPWQ